MYSDTDGSELSKLSKQLWSHYKNLPSAEYFLNALISMMKQLKDAEAFGPNTGEVTCFVSMSDDEAASAKQLNSPEFANALLNRAK